MNKLFFLMLSSIVFFILNSASAFSERAEWEFTEKAEWEFTEKTLPFNILAWSSNPPVIVVNANKKNTFVHVGGKILNSNFKLIEVKNNHIKLHRNTSEGEYWFLYHSGMNIKSYRITKIFWQGS